METAFLNKKEVAELFHVSPQSVRRILERQGVLPVHIPGRGKTAALLWSKDDVMQAVDILRTKSRMTPADYIKPRRHDLRIIGKSAADVYAMVTQ